jgi:hypothetical protein
VADVEAILKSAVAVIVPLGTLIGSIISIGNRKSRIRKEIRENLALLGDIEKDSELGEFALPTSWMRARIVVDTARLTGQTLGTPKKPLPVGSMVFAAILGLFLAALTWWIDRDGFVWYSVFPAALSFLSLVSLYGQTLNREIDPSKQLPPGASPVLSENATEQIATRLALARSEPASGPDSVTDQADTVLNFVRRIEDGLYEEAVELAEENWLDCRIRSWVWANFPEHRSDVSRLVDMSNELLRDRESHPNWSDFVATETRLFLDAWVDDERLSDYGVARNRRRLSADCDLVILVPVGDSGGYFVERATAIPGAVTFIVRKYEAGWKVVSHLGTAPPIPDMPPVWWTPADQTWNELSVQRDDQAAS